MKKLTIHNFERIKFISVLPTVYNNYLYRVTEVASISGQYEFVLRRYKIATLNAEYVILLHFHDILQECVISISDMSDAMWNICNCKKVENTILKDPHKLINLVVSEITKHETNNI